MTMADEKPVADTGTYRSTRPIIHSIGPADLKFALVMGLADFKAMPTHLVFLCLIYPIVIVMLARVYAGYEVLPLVFPLLAGYTLIGPLVATGMYELSRRREMGLDTSRLRAFEVIRSPSIGAIAILGIVLMAIYFVWLFTAQGIYNLYFGGAVPESIGGVRPPGLRHLFRLGLDNRGRRRRLHLRVCGVRPQRGVVSDASGPGHRRHDGGWRVGKGGSREPDNVGDMGRDCRGQPVDRLPAIFRRPGGRDAGARTFDLASLSQGCGTLRRLLYQS